MVDREVQLKTGTASDIEDIIRIEKLSFKRPWHPWMIDKVLRQESCWSLVAVIGYVAVGFAIYILEDECIELIDIAVDPAYRRQGVGEAMMHRLQSMLRPGHREWMCLEVKDTNVNACRFFAACGMREVDGIMFRSVGFECEV